MKYIVLVLIVLSVITTAIAVVMVDLQVSGWGVSLLGLAFALYITREE